MDIILLFLAKPLDKHGTTLVHITYPPLLKTDVNNLKRNVESEKQKRFHLDFYSRRENLRLIGVKENGDDECVKENGDEGCEKLVRKILDEMGVLRYGLDFHAVHRVPRVVPS